MKPKPCALPRPPKPVAPALAEVAAPPPPNLDALLAERRKHVENLGLLDAEIERLAFESICGNKDDTVDVEAYAGDLGVTRAFCDTYEPPVAQLQWIEDLAARFNGPNESPGNVANVRWGSGGLFTNDLFITAGHCFDQEGGGWQRPSRGGVTISSAEIAKLMQVNFKFQKVGTTQEIRAGESFPVEELVEFRTGGLDFAIARLGRNAAGRLPGEVYGVLKLAAQDLTTSAAMLALIQHPAGVPKRIEAGPMLHNENGQISYDSLDTLGGSSGAPILSGATGEIVGVHTNGGCSTFSGANFGVAIGKIRQISTTLANLADSDDLDLALPETPANLSDREGYKSDFLGDAAVPLPTVVRNPENILTFGDDDETVLKYHHYSVVMHRPRRMCIFSAVNIDGDLSKKKKRTAWKRDPRIPNNAQIIQECYGDPPKFSRGHMTRREDPVWGTDAIAGIANSDTMFVTNAVPQMQIFNAPIWLGLEDYALEHAREDKMQICVFTGPVFKDTDRTFNGVVVPVTFWKIIAFIHDETGELSATGYTMTQLAQLPGGPEFVFGQYDQRQVTISSIQDLTGLDFGPLAALDPLAGAPETATPDPLTDPRQIRFHR